MNPQEEMKMLEEAIEKITAKAREFDLDFYDMYFEICPADIIYTFGAYGMPTRFSHWSFGKSYQKMKTQYDYNLSRIYELVINSNPCYAFLLEGNTLIQNKLVVAHVLAHCDFFKNNAYFQHTSRKMVESMSASADRFREYEFKYGKQKVERFIDAVISIQEHIDPHSRIKQPEGNVKEQDCQCGSGAKSGCESGCGSGCGSGCCGADGGKKQSCDGKHRHDKKQATPYDDLWDLDEKDKVEEDDEKPVKFPERPTKDLLLFMMENARELKDWQRDIISVIRQEMLYFWPQIQTKIMNEGWASYWHLRIIREMDLTEDEAIEFSKMNAGVIQSSPMRINPYLLGLKIFEDIEKRWDNPGEEERKKYNRPGGEGRKKIFEVRETECDVSFLRNYLTKELIEDMDLYLYKKAGYEWKVTDKEWETVRDGIVASMTNSGFPYLVVEDGDFNKRGELYLKHQFDGLELDVYYAEKTLPQVYKIWGRTVHMETVLDNKKVLFSYNGEKSSKKFL
ncbi:stage V sporulation protein SpoVR [Desulfocucumis palustris]|uniref:Stage V sporulation protein SpoVR n=1 Tax=Desulfocucumis palustris TaxID=1898651 RepID=A0A2L2X9D5_9FIRM|nr:SpoVR family protein [Desulfocucumis palustris]GBF32642.1 stage V sporulation protein SpoVR [Desulfocucumis palustris]